MQWSIEEFVKQSERMADLQVSELELNGNKALKELENEITNIEKQFGFDDPDNVLEPEEKMERLQRTISAAATLGNGYSAAKIRKGLSMLKA